MFLKLLEKKKRVQLKDMVEDLECLCQIMRTVGPRLDHEKAKVRAKDAIGGMFEVSGVFVTLETDHTQNIGYKTVSSSAETTPFKRLVILSLYFFQTLVLV